MPFDALPADRALRMAYRDRYDRCTSPEEREWFDDIVYRTQTEWDLLADEAAEAEAEQKRRLLAFLEPNIVRGD